MGLYAVDCQKCGDTFVWFSGNLPEKYCERCTFENRLLGDWSKNENFNGSENAQTQTDIGECMESATKRAEENFGVNKESAESPSIVETTKKNET